MAVLEQLERKSSFTESEVALADHILAHATDVTEMSIAELAEKTFTSNATIIRFCRKLGTTGYREFRVKLATDLERRRMSQEGVDANSPLATATGTSQVMRSLSVLLKGAIDETFASVRSYDVQRAAYAIRDARNLYIFATGDSQISAMSFANMLMKLGIHCIMADSYGETVAIANTMRSGDAALIISYSGKIVNTPAMRRVMRMLTERSVRTIWMSSAEKPFGVDMELRIVPREDAHAKTATFYSQMCIRYLLDCLYGVVFALDYEGSSAIKGSTDSIDVALSALLQQ